MADIENQVTGPLFKVQEPVEKKSWGAEKYSASKLTIALSQFTLLVWTLIALNEFIQLLYQSFPKMMWFLTPTKYLMVAKAFLMLLFTTFWCWLISWRAKTSSFIQGDQHDAEREQGDHMKKRKHFWKWIGQIMGVVIPLAGLAMDDLHQRSEVSRYREQQTPEMDCFYTYFTENEEHKFIISNTGLVDCKNIWTQEEVFLLVDGKVYEGDGVPHLDHFVYKGSRDRMWDLERGGKQEVNIVELQIKAFYELKKKFNPVIISKWKIAFSKENSSKRYHYENSFIFDFDDRRFKVLKDYVGGKSYENKIGDYLSSGSRQAVDIFEITGDFEIDPPKAFLIRKDYSFVPLYPWTKLGLKDFRDALLFCAGGFEIQPSDDKSEGSLRYSWEYENGRWSKEVLRVGGIQAYSKPFGMPLSYLSEKDLQMVKTNPSLQKLIFPDQRMDGSHYSEIISKAREKYLSEKYNN